MPSISTIFLTTDGRHATLGPGDDVDISMPTVTVLAETGVRGWVVVLSGDDQGRGPVALSRVHAVEHATDEEWAPAVIEFMAERDRRRA